MPTIEENSFQKKGTCTIVDLCGPLFRADLCCHSVHFFPEKTTGDPLCWYCLRRQLTGMKSLPIFYYF